jgi:hypothetical protein
MEQYGGVQLNPVGKNFNDAYQTIQIGLENSTLSGAAQSQGVYNSQGVNFDNSQNTQNTTRYNGQELTSNSTSKPVNPKELENQMKALASFNRDLL